MLFYSDIDINSVLYIYTGIGHDDSEKKNSFQFVILLEIHPYQYNLPQPPDIKLVHIKSLYN
jgi:hypothetical protein